MTKISSKELVDIIHWKLLQREKQGRLRSGESNLLRVIESHHFGYFLPKSERQALLADTFLENLVHTAFCDINIGEEVLKDEL